MISRSRPRSQKGKGLSSKSQGSPGRRRVTRSQSRDVEDTRASAKGISTKGRVDGRTTQGQTQALDPVVEEDPRKTLQTSTSRHASAVVSESPEDDEDEEQDDDDGEDAANISGTTFLPETAVSEPDESSDMMLEVLLDLERTGRDVLDFLASTNDGPATIVNKAQLLSNPGNTPSRRLRRSVGRLNSDMEFFGDEDYIDTQSVRRQFKSLFAGRPGDLAAWRPDPIVQMANCARFAQQILLAGSEKNLQRKAVNNIKDLFPLPFVSGLVGPGQPREAGESYLDKATFDFALHIRTQSLILQLEDNQDNPNFKPKQVAKLCFFTGLSRKSPLRGFKFPDFSGPDGTLPEQYTDSVRIIYDDFLLAEDKDSDHLDVAEVRDSYPWRKFVLRAARWLISRKKEIKDDLENRKRLSAQDVHKAFFASKHSSLATTVGGAEAEPSGDTEAGEAPQKDAEQEVPASEPQQQQQQEQQLSRPPQQDEEHRRSSRPSYLNASSIQILAQRRERLRLENAEPSERHRQSDIVQPVSQIIHDPDVNRRQTSSALPSRSQEAAPAEPAVSFDAGSPTLLPDAPEITFNDDDYGLDIEDENTQIERSHSPPTVRRGTAPWRRESTSSTQRTDRPSMGQRVWDAAKGALFSQATPGPAWDAAKDAIFNQATPAPGRTVAQRFIDRQHDAARVSPIRDSESQSADKRVEQHTWRKRARESSETESEDGGDIFHHDDRTVNVERRRAEKPQQSRSKRPRVDEPRARVVSHSHSQVRVDADDGVREPGPERALERTGHRRQTTTIDAVRSPQPAPKGRRKWTEEQDKRFLRLIREIGRVWYVIEREDRAQPPQPGEAKINRDQVAMKDRCRNQIMSKIRNGAPIPEPFVGQTLKEKDCRYLSNRGYAVPNWCWPEEKRPDA